MKENTKCATAEINIPEVIKDQKGKLSAAPALTTFEELIETVQIVPRLSLMPQGTSQPGSSHVRLSFANPLSGK